MQERKANDRYRTPTDNGLALLFRELVLDPREAAGLCAVRSALELGVHGPPGDAESSASSTLCARVGPRVLPGRRGRGAASAGRVRLQRLTRPPRRLTAARPRTHHRNICAGD